MTDAEIAALTEHRLKQLEAVARGARHVERQVDLLNVSVQALQGTLAEQKAESGARDEQLHSSLARLHARLDQLAADENREQGAKDERDRLGRWLIAAVGASAAISSVVVTVAALALQFMQ